MARGKIVSEDEVIRWIEEGRTYQWMTEEYARKYNVDITPSAFANVRYRRGLQRRIARNDELIPWRVEEPHRFQYPLAMLRVEARRREGRELRTTDAERLASWKRQLTEQGLVVHYDPETEEGFFYVPRREGVDTDLIREPSPEGVKV